MKSFLECTVVTSFKLHYLGVCYASVHPDHDPLKSFQARSLSPSSNILSDQFDAIGDVCKLPSARLAILCKVFSQLSIRLLLRR